MLKLYAAKRDILVFLSEFLYNPFNLQTEQGRCLSQSMSGKAKAALFFTSHIPISYSPSESCWPLSHNCIVTVLL